MNDVRRSKEPSPAASGTLPNPDEQRLGKPPRKPFLNRLFRKLTLQKRRKAWRAKRAHDRAIREIAKFPKNPDAPRHGLPGRLIISLTSYPARFPSLHLTIKSLLDQSVRPDQIVLWIAHDDIAVLPDTLTSLQSERFRIGACDDIRNFKKILPTLTEYPDAFIVICDDDTYYPDDWLKGLVDAFDPQQPSIVCYRCHRLGYTPEGRLAPYRSWVRNDVGDNGGTLTRNVLPTGNGGVLYPPGSLPPETTNLEMIRQLSATSDDVWLFFMWRQNGWSIKRVPGPRREFTEWSGTQDQALWSLHRTGKKDEHLQSMSDHFGVP